MKFKYYAYPHLNFGNNLNKIQNEIELILDKDENIKMNLERFEVLKYFKDPKVALYRDQEFINNIESFKKIIKGNIGRYFNSKVNLEKELESLCEISPEYIITFLQVISYYKLDNKVKDFGNLLLSLPDRHLSSILQNKYLVNKYPKVVSKKILQDYENATILINVLNLNSEYTDYSLPPSAFFNTDQINKLFLRYIESDKPNLNYLKQIYQGKFSIDIETRVRSLANEVYNEVIENMFEKNNLDIISGTEVIITKLEDELVKIDNSYKENKYNIKILINEEWLNESLDFNSILQNMLYIVELVDNRFRISAIPNNESESVVERAIGLDDQNAYFTSSIFKILESQYYLMFMAYIKFLKQKKINILEVIEWYLKDYLVEEYGISNFNLEILDKNVPIRVVNNDLHTQFQRIIKMYHLYSKYGGINTSEVDIETNKRFGDLKGINGIKYLYLNSNELKNCAYCLFSDQSLLGIYGKENKFFITLEAGEIKYTDIKGYTKNYVDLLLENNLVEIEDEFLAIRSRKYFILKELFFKSTINYYWITADERRVIDRMIENEELSTSDSLLSKKEVDYFNYYLNNYYSNGVALRNKYSHASTENLTEKDHKINYAWLCYLIVLFIIKINEEFNYKFDFK